MTTRSLTAFETRVVNVLQDICDVLQGMRADANAPVPIVCTHPEDQREDFGTFGTVAWRCKVCGYSVGLDT